jgi:formate dehydrogenase major subunit
MDRRNFLKGTGAAALAGLLGTAPRRGEVHAASGKLTGGEHTTTICPFCAVGCGLIVTSSGGKIVNVEGDPDHPINRGALCSKGAALPQVAHNDRRLTRVRYRAPGSTEWQDRSWDWAMPRIAARIMKTRDETFLSVDEKGRTVSRTEAIACLGGAALDNEECYAYSKLARALGVVYLEHQARI